jgi:predicted nucleotidyltransferase
MPVTTDIEKQLSDLKPTLKKRFNVKNIGVFGSYAEREAADDSDIDILVDLSEPLGWKFFDLKDYLEQQLGRSVDLVTRKALKKRLKDKILSQTKFV